LDRHDAREAAHRSHPRVLERVPCACACDGDVPHRCGSSGRLLALQRACAATVADDGVPSRILRSSRSRPIGGGGRRHVALRLHVLVPDTGPRILWVCEAWPPVPAASAPAMDTERRQRRSCTRLGNRRIASPASRPA
jgi:hypothetical protein